MRRIVVFSALGLLALAVPAQAAHYTPAPPPPKACQPHAVGFRAIGTLVGESLTPVGKGRYSGTIEVNVGKANHGAPTGDETFTLESARVKFHHGVDATAPAAGSRVTLHGKMTKLAKHCSTEGFTPTTTIRKVDLSPAKAKHPHG
ncbi:MAG TPA: hypothetical protein VHU24_05435 [Solirubrobacterales bacterium]|jgi:hypothetical protein|nr:hypothetical protein [Solirubrobacterales bacterium]